MCCSFGLCRGQCLNQFRLLLYTFHTVSSLVFLKPQIHPYVNRTKVERSSELFKKTEKYPYVFWCVSQRVWKSEWNCFFLFTVFFSSSLRGTVISRFISSKCLTICPFLKLPKTPFSWSVRKAQRARLRLLYPSAYPSSEHALDLNADGQLPSDLSQDVQAGLAFLCCQEVWNLFFLGEVHTQTTASVTHSTSTLRLLEGQGTFICSSAIDMLLKTAVSGTTVKYALSMTEPSSIMGTSIPSLFPYHFLDLREKIAPWSECIPSYKPLKLHRLS